MFYTWGVSNVFSWPFIIIYCWVSTHLSFLLSIYYPLLLSRPIYYPVLTVNPNQVTISLGQQFSWRSLRNNESAQKTATGVLGHILFEWMFLTTFMQMFSKNVNNWSQTIGLRRRILLCSNVCTGAYFRAEMCAQAHTSVQKCVHRQLPCRNMCTGTYCRAPLCAQAHILSLCNVCI